MDLADHYEGRLRPQRKLSDYVSTAQISDVYASGVEMLTRKSPGNPCSEKIVKLSTPKNDKVMCQIQRQVTSPSSLRVRAVRSFQHPTPISTPIESNRTTPERNLTDTLPNGLTIQDVMKDIVIYVEVRTGEDNRSAGVRKVIAALGAKVNNKLTRSTTHVVFKDGLLSTYKRAKSMNIPIVSILWIEACKNELRICDPADFPISNLDRYENPELYEKLKRYKSVSQSASEGHKRVRSKKPVKESLKSTSKQDVSKFSQNEIPHYFKNQNSNSQLSSASGTPARMAAGSSAFESPATVLLNRISMQTYTPIANAKKPNCAAKQETSYAQNSANLNQDSQNSASAEHQQKEPIDDIGITKTTNNMAQMSISKTLELKDSFTQTPDLPGIRRRRTLAPLRSQIVTPNSRQEKHSRKQTKLAMSDDLVLSQSKVDRRTTYSHKAMDIVEVETTPTTTADFSKQTLTSRRTLFTPQNMLASPNVQSNVVKTNSTSTRAAISNSHNIVDSMNTASNGKTAAYKRRTIFTPQNMTESPNVDGDGEDAPCTPPARIGDEITKSYTVTPSSASIGRRRTLFDLSMDIISQQVSHLNTKSRLSIAPQHNKNIPDSATKIDDSDCPKAVSVQLSENTSQETGQKENNSAVESIETITSAQLTTVNPKTEKKRRKLFKPVESSPFTPSTPQLSSISNSRKSLSTPSNTLRSAVKRRRTLMQKPNSSEEIDMPPGQKEMLLMGKSQSAIKANLSSSPRTRRSTLDFEAIKRIRSKSNSTGIDEPQSHSVLKENNSQQPNTIENVGDVKIPPKKRLPFLAFTNMHKEQVDVINEAVEVLGKFKLDRTVCSATTHLISLEPRRTMNLLRGLVRGLWILNYAWVVDSLKAGRWLPEESYEMKDFSRAVEICRAERQAFGHNYKCELFTDLGPFFISPRCDNIPIRELKELIRLCGGKVEDHRQNAKFILSSCTKAFDDKIYVTPLWILDSITQMQLMRIQKYSAVTQLPTTQTASNTRNMPTAIDIKDPNRLPNMERIHCSNHQHSKNPSKIVIDSRLSAIYSRTCTS